ncbi:MAG: flagellar hook protein FlgE [Acidimicrobiales bacterium]
MPVISLAAADSGISTMQTEIDTIGNNVANADSDGYQQADVQFSDILTQELAPGSGASTGLASTDPATVGAGAQVAAMQTNFNQGAIVQTGVPTDAAIQGNGFFVVSEGANTYYTRDGDFQLDVNGTLAAANGAVVQGWAGTTSTTGPTGPITIPSSMTIPPQETANVTMGGNIPSGGTAFTTTATMYDAQGNAVPLTLTYTPSTSTPNVWTMQASVNGTNLFSSGVALTFDSTGQLESYTVDGGASQKVTGQASIPTTQALPTGFNWNEKAIDFVFPASTSNDAVTQYTTEQTVGAASQDGYTEGSLQSWSIGQNGVITGTFTNGQSEQLGTIALANFSNPGGLDNLGNLQYQTTAASGLPQTGTPGSAGRGTLLGGALEQSNVDLANQLTSLIEAQTDYEADTKVVSSTETALQALVTNA